MIGLEKYLYSDVDLDEAAVYDVVRLVFELFSSLLLCDRAVFNYLDLTCLSVDILGQYFTPILARSSFELDPTTAYIR